jgi:ribosome-binding factor A
MNVRNLKIAAQIKRLVSIVLSRGVGDPRVDGLISVTYVKLSPDLREAKVGLSIMGATAPDKTVLAGIVSAGRHLQHEVADGLAMRTAPRLSFELDESLKREAEILKLVKEANATSGNESPRAGAAPEREPQPE